MSEPKVLWTGQETESAFFLRLIEREDHWLHWQGKHHDDDGLWFGVGSEPCPGGLRLILDERTALEAERDSLRKLVDALARELADWLPTLPEEHRPSDYGKVALLARREAPEPAEAPQEEVENG